MVPLEYWPEQRTPEQAPPRLSEKQLKEELRLQRAYANGIGCDRSSRFSPGHLFITQRREKCFLESIAGAGWASLTTKKILQIRCGWSDFLSELVEWGACPENLTGVDVLPNRISEGKLFCLTHVSFDGPGAASLNYPSEHFDLVMQSGAFSSILDFNVRRQLASEMLRVVKKDGLILWYDFRVNSRWNADLRGVKKQEIYKLFQCSCIDFRRITLASFLARSIAPYSWLLCYLLDKIPWCCTHYLAIIRKS